jgi:hypothetical protein
MLLDWPPRQPPTAVSRAASVFSVSSVAKTFVNFVPYSFVVKGSFAHG